jgi:hypothetical protein
MQRFDKQARGDERERERALLKKRERERQEGERTGGRGSKLTTRARRCVPEGINTRIYPVILQLATALEIPVASIFKMSEPNRRFSQKGRRNSPNNTAFNPLCTRRWSVIEFEPGYK